MLLREIQGDFFIRILLIFSNAYDVRVRFKHPFIPIDGDDSPGNGFPSSERTSHRTGFCQVAGRFTRGFRTYFNTGW